MLWSSQPALPRASTPFSVTCAPQIGIWNPHGLNDGARRTGVHSLIASASANIVCLQETKLDNVTGRLAMETLGSEFDGYFTLPTDGTHGGILLAWKSHELSIASPMITANAVTAFVTTGQAFGWLTTPKRTPKKCMVSLLLCGDFNVTLDDAWKRIMGFPIAA